ncbi:MAG: penicillin-binding protein 2, partial [Chloroflexota bacterium]|nr:penicillin-binding protein 2 [Chloroflexota bacterium]
AAWLLLLVGFWPRLPSTLPQFNRTVVRTAVVLTTVFAILSVQLVRIQIVQGDVTERRVARAPNGDSLANPRLQNESLSIRRGRVFDRNGVLIADTVKQGDIWARVYPEPESAYLVGYYSPLRYGNAGLEASFDDELSGRSANNPFLRWENNLLHRPQSGVDLQLTLDADLQRYAHELLGGRAGAVVLLEVETGAVLTMASNPHYDPNRLFTGNPSDAEAAGRYWERLISDEAAPLVLRATEGLFSPGSTFKTVTAAAAVDSGLASPSSTYEDDGALVIEGHTIPEYNRPDDTIETWTLSDGLAWSLNVVLARVGLQLGPDRLQDYAARFGFGEEIPFDLPVARSQLASTPEFLDSPPALADTAFGQGQILASPLHMALVAAGIANDGVIMQPYLVSGTRDVEGVLKQETGPEVWRRPIGTESAAQLQDMMVNAVENGYAAGAQIEGLVVGGKTGTAEVGDGEPHAWFIAFVGDPEPRYAVAVVLEHGGVGLGDSLTIAREMLAAAVAGEATS